MTEVRVHQDWIDLGGIPLAIMRGEHDDMLSSIQDACKKRLKARFRKGTRCRLVNTKRVEFDGLEVVIDKVNQKSVAVRVTGTGEGLNVPPHMLEAI